MEEPTSDYGEGFGFTRGTFTSILTRPRASVFGGSSSNKGWGFNHPTRSLFNEFEAGDPRRELTVGQLDDEISTEVEVNYLGNPYYNYKTAYMEHGLIPGLNHDSRGPLNYRLVRASDVLLLFAEAALESGKSTADAKWLSKKYAPEPAQWPLCRVRCPPSLTAVTPITPTDSAPQSATNAVWNSAWKATDGLTSYAGESPMR